MSESAIELAQISSASSITQILLENSVNIIDIMFEAGYAKKNPNLLASVLTTQQQIYNSRINKD